MQRANFTGDFSVESQWLCYTWTDIGNAFFALSLKAEGYCRPIPSVRLSVRLSVRVLL